MKTQGADAVARAVAVLRGLLPQVRTADRWRMEERLESLLPPRSRSVVEKSLLRLIEEAEASRAAVESRRETTPRVRYPSGLPIVARREEIVRVIRENSVVILAGETGSGKTTQLPKLCLEAGGGLRGQIACTQPRRIAALSVSRRVAEELGVEWGREVGAKIRFTDKTSDETRIKFVTDGMLLAELQQDRLLSAYDTLIIDEAHERSLNIDFLLGYVRQLRERRDDLKVIVTSATLDTKKFAEAFGGAPVVEVSGRTFPVEVIYRPVEEWLDRNEDGTYIEAAARAVEEITAGGAPGDVLVFLPTERDIRETCDLLGRLALRRVEIVPLYGRLSSGEQQGVFQATQARKVIVATNIAETSLTIPGIRFVVDAGLVRMARYHAATRTQRLPIEAISQSSAEQRKGRAGRVEAGVCIRLYDEKDYNKRSKYTPPEIRRSNLASVILTMLAFDLGDPADFPFLDPPSVREINGGYDLLHELGAVDAARRLTDSGRELARLPVDPTVGKMLLQASKEHCLREVLVIAAALSIQDPRERPADQREAADRMHRKFVDRQSDFVTLLRIWDGYHDDAEKLSQRQLRRFCREHFLNYLRMREWRDVHNQLERTLRDLGRLRISELAAEPEAIHRAVLAGLLGNVAIKKELNLYTATKNRLVMLHPGSGLFDGRAAEQARGQGEKARRQIKSRTPEWIMAGQWLETSRLFAVTVAGIDPRWILSLAEHLFSLVHADPVWSRKAGRVLVWEKRILYGLEVERKRVGYGRIDPVAATEIFVREALVPGELEESVGVIEDNRAVQARAEDWQTRLRRSSTWSLEERACQFYLGRLTAVSSVAELRRFLNENGPDALAMREEDLLEDLPGDGTLDAFPEAATIRGTSCPIEYVYRPGEEDDGASLRVPLERVEDVVEADLDWAVPGFIRDRVEATLRGLPKRLRTAFFPLGEASREVVEALSVEQGAISVQVAAWLTQRLQETIPATLVREAEVPEYLVLRVVVDRKGEAILAGRELGRVQEAVRERLGAHQRRAGAKGEEVFEEARRRYRKGPLTGWTFGDLAEKIELGTFGGLPLAAYPGLLATKEGVIVDLFREEALARERSRSGVRSLLLIGLRRDWAWFQRDLRKELSRVSLLFAPLGKVAVLTSDLETMALAMLDREEVWPLVESRFQAGLERARKELRGLPQALVDDVRVVLEKRAELQKAESYPQKNDDLKRLASARFAAMTPREKLQDLARYLDAAIKRSQRAPRQPDRDAQRVALVTPWVARLSQLYAKKTGAREAWQARERFRWLLEEYRVSLFAQELGTREKISERRLEEVWHEAAKQWGLDQ